MHKHIYVHTYVILSNNIVFKWDLRQKAIQGNIFYSTSFNILQSQQQEPQYPTKGNDNNKHVLRDFHGGLVEVFITTISSSPYTIDNIYFSN